VLRRNPLLHHSTNPTLRFFIESLCPLSPAPMGILVVASLAARVESGPPVTMTSILIRTRSDPSAGRRSCCPSPYRYSMTILSPSTYPSSRRPWRNASRRFERAEVVLPPRKAIRGILVSCASVGKLTAKSRAASAKGITVFISFFDLWLNRLSTGKAEDWSISTRSIIPNFN
jgi:hypothetical protein